MTITFDLPSEVADRLHQKAAQEGQDMAGFLRQIAVREAGSDGSVTTAEPRTAGLHAGWYWIAEDFDAPLPDSFWLGVESPGSETDLA